MGSWAYLGKKEIGKRMCPAPVPSEGSGRQQDGFFSEIRFPISFFPTPPPADTARIGAGGENREADFREE